MSLEDRVSQLERDRLTAIKNNGILTEKIDQLTQLYYHDKLCKSGKVAQFLSAVAVGSPTACAPLKLEEALRFMSNQPVAFAVLRIPSDKSNRPSGLSSLHPGREDYLRTVLLNPDELYPSTRLLILYQAHADTPEAAAYAREVAKAFLNMTRSDLLPMEHRNMPILGPYPLPCVLKSEEALKQLYSSGSLAKLSESLPTEPTGKEPRIRIWIYRTDCLPPASHGTTP
jgi:hypothetical protein